MVADLRPLVAVPPRAGPRSARTQPSRTGNARREAWDVPTPPPDESVPDAEQSPDPYAREFAIEQLTGPEDGDD